MKLLVVGPDIQDLRRVKNFTGAQAFYICRELRKRGVGLVFVDGKHPDPLRYLADVDGQGCDHVLALGLRWFTHQPIGCASILATKVPGKVTQLHDGLVHEWLAPHMKGVDCTFMFRDDATRVKEWWRYSATNHFIGWAADPEIFYPAQKANELRILLDHPYYKSGTPDYTESVTADALMFSHTGIWSSYARPCGLPYERVRIRRLINGGAEDVTLKDPLVRKFDRQHVPLEDIAREYRAASVYVVTHKESVGLTCLELAMCGALVAAPRGLIYQDRLDTIRHVTYDGVRAPWDTILAEIDVLASAKLAKAQTWSRVVDRMLEWFVRQ